MLPSTQLRDDAQASYTQFDQPVARVAVDRTRRESETLGPPGQDVNSNRLVAQDKPARRKAIGPWMQTLGAVGVVVGSACAGFFAHQMGYDWRLTAMISGLAGAAGGSLGMMLPLLFRALFWTILATFFGIIGAGALYFLMRVAPAFVERIIG